MAQIGMDQLANRVSADIEAKLSTIDQHTDKSTAQLTDSPAYLCSTLDNNQ